MKNGFRRNLKRAGMLPIALAVGGVLLLMQISPTCVPDTLLQTDQPGTQAQTDLFATELQPGRTLTPEELDQLVANADERGIVVVFMNPVPGPTGPSGPQGPKGPSGPAGAGPLVGEVRMWTGNLHEIPPGWLSCDGSARPRAAFPKLFELVGTRYGQGDGATTFNLPDFRNRSPMGADGQSSQGQSLTTVDGTARQFGGAAYHQLTVDELPVHAHALDHQHDIEGAVSGMLGASVVQLIDPTSSPETVKTFSPMPTHTDSTGNDQPHYNVHPYFAITYIIFAGES